MSDENKARLAHDVLDGMFAGRILSRENEQLLRSFLPELPTQMSLEALRHDVHDVWAGVNGNEWPDDMYCDLETWLYELHAQLQGLKDTPIAVPSLPEGMRLADHENFGRVVVSPGVGIDKCHEIFYLEPGMSSATGISEVEPDSLTFIDAEPTEPAHPEVLETVADYEKAPEGTIVGDYLAPSKKKPEVMWQKLGDGKWWFVGGSHYASMPDNTRNVIRWGRGE